MFLQLNNAQKNGVLYFTTTSDFGEIGHHREIYKPIKDKTLKQSIYLPVKSVYNKLTTKPTNSPLPTRGMWYPSLEIKCASKSQIVSSHVILIAYFI